jgi:hypothetical protein
MAMRLNLRTALLFVSLTITGAARAGEHANANGKFSIWLPDPWTVKESGPRIEAHNPKDTVQVVVGPLKDPDADLTDEDVADFIDDELDAMTIKKDVASKQDGLAARILEGTGEDEDDDVDFRSIAVDPGGNAPVIVVLVYGETEAMSRDDIERIVNRILHSLKPI